MLPVRLTDDRCLSRIHIRIACKSGSIVISLIPSFQELSAHAVRMSRLMVLRITDASGGASCEAIPQNGHHENIATIREIKEADALLGG